MAVGTTVGAVRSVWTSRDEAALLELTERKQRVMAEMRAPVDRLVASMNEASVLKGGSGCGLGDHDTWVDVLIEHAEALRDALAPFDSGTRAGT